MFYNLKRILCSAMLATVIGFMAIAGAQAQGNVTLEGDDQPMLSNDNADFLGVDGSIPDQLSLPEEDGLGGDGLMSPGGRAMQAAANDNALISFDETTEVPLETNSGPAPLNAPLTGPNSMPSTGPNSRPLSGPNSMPLTGPNSMPMAVTESETEISIPAPLKSPITDGFGENILSQIDNQLFSQMSDLEKQTALLTLELRREKIKNEIAAIKAQRQKALDEEEAKKEEKERKRIEWEKDQEAKIIREKKLLEEATIKLEKIKQEKALKAYKDTMLATNQKWIKNNAMLYEQIQNQERNRKNLMNNVRNKMAHLTSLTEKATGEAQTAKENYDRELKNLQTQISILKSRLEAEIAEKKNDKTNPFAQAEVVAAPVKEAIKLSDEYVIMEIRGKGENLVAKLINRGGDSFMVKKGTVLQSGHMVDEITQTYIRADVGGSKDYLYFSAGGILDKEPSKSDLKSTKKPTTAAKKPDNTTMISQGVPSLGSGMFVR